MKVVWNANENVLKNEMKVEKKHRKFGKMVFQNW